jgi:hypothetical protein
MVNFTFDFVTEQPMKKCYEILVYRPNKWYDTVAEPLRLVIFVVPIIVLSIFVNVIPPFWALITMVGLVLPLLWRFFYLHRP